MKTFIAVVLDRSGSMSAVREATIAGFNSFLKDQRKCPGEALFTLVQFDDQYQIDYDGAALETVDYLTSETYVPRGGTALYDAIGRTVDSVGAKLAGMNVGDRPDRVLIMIQTDGHENASKEYSRRRVADMIKHQRDKYSWDFVFVGASEQAIADAVAMGVDQRWTSSYTPNVAGTKQVFDNISTSTRVYRGMPSRGSGFFNP